MPREELKVEEKKIKVECFRYCPETDDAPYYVTYEVPLAGRMSVLDCLNYIRENLDPGLTYFINCKKGFCARCALEVDGKKVLGCTCEVKGDIKVKPIKEEKVIKDLWCKNI